MLTANDPEEVNNTTDRNPQIVKTFVFQREFQMLDLGENLQKDGLRKRF